MRRSKNRKGTITLKNIRLGNPEKKRKIPEMKKKRSSMEISLVMFFRRHTTGDNNYLVGVTIAPPVSRKTHLGEQALH